MRDDISLIKCCSSGASMSPQTRALPAKPRRPAGRLPAHAASGAFRGTPPPAGTDDLSGRQEAADQVSARRGRRRRALRSRA